MNDPTLFDPARTTTTACPVCDAVREPDQELAPDCRFDQARDAGEIGKRPRACLNAYDPAHADIPY